MPVTILNFRYTYVRLQEARYWFTSDFSDLKTQNLCTRYSHYGSHYGTLHYVLYMYRYLTRDFISVADPDPGSGIRCLFDPWIRDPE
jgi:hypothetical protein